MVYTGNDIVDPAISGSRHKDQRFLHRVFTAYETRIIENADNPEIMLWCLWAGKETAFKAVSKLTDPPVFSHRRFKHKIFDWQSSRSGITAEGTVAYENYKTRISWHANQKVIHAVGKLSDNDRQPVCEIYSGYSDIQSVEQSTKFTSAERESIRFPEAALVRSKCKKAISATTGFAVDRLQILRPVRDNKLLPPYLLVDDKPSDIDISLTHHGRWVAWAYSVPAKVTQTA
jgi:phosphopantetheinyl transferase (holo-ACP synthase)